MGHVITKAEPVIDAVARTPRIARDDRCPGEERTGVGLYVTQPTIERQAAHEFPAGVDVGIPRAGSHVAEVEPRSRPDGQSRAARAQRVFVAGVEGGLDCHVVPPAIAAINERTLRGIVKHGRGEVVPDQRLTRFRHQDEPGRLRPVVAHRDAAVKAVLGKRARTGADCQPRADHQGKCLFPHCFPPRNPPVIHIGRTGISTIDLTPGTRASQLRTCIRPRWSRMNVATTSGSPSGSTGKAVANGPSVATATIPGSWGCKSGLPTLSR